jgi:hypothetical protein
MKYRCPTRYRTRHFFNNFTTNEDIETKFEADFPHCVRNVKERNVRLFKFRCIIFIGVRIIKEMTGSVASGTSCIIFHRDLFEILDVVCLWTAPTARLLPTCRDSKLFLSSDQDFFFGFLTFEDKTKIQSKCRYYGLRIDSAQHLRRSNSSRVSSYKL